MQQFHYTIVELWSPPLLEIYTLYVETSSVEFYINIKYMKMFYQKKFSHSVH